MSKECALLTAKTTQNNLFKTCKKAQNSLNNSYNQYYLTKGKKREIPNIII